MATNTETTIITEQLKNKVSEIRPGDTVRIHQTIKEGGKERIQVFEGVVLAKKHGNGINATITVRKVSQGIGVERIFPLHAPFIQKIEIVKRAKVRRAKLYYLRDAKGKKARLKAKEFGVEVIEQEPEKPAEEPKEEIQEEAAETQQPKTEAKEATTPEQKEQAPAQEETKKE